MIFSLVWKKHVSGKTFLKKGYFPNPFPKTFVSGASAPFQKNMKSIGFDVCGN
jgi:hypothetical protein